MKFLEEYAKKYGIPSVVNNMGETRQTRENSIVFPNGWVASIILSNEPYSVAMCNYDGYFDWTILNQYGATDGKFICATELEIIIACETIRRLQTKKEGKNK
jgi:hypothetical protein